VAIIDSGVDYTHEEFGLCTLEQVNIGDCPKILPGYNFLLNTNDPMDDNGHGTHVGGVIAAISNNGVGIAGIANPEVKLIAYKTFDKSGNAFVTNIVAAIERSIQDGVRVINASFGIEANSETLKDAVRYAYENNVVFVAAAGNDNVDVSRFSPAKITCATQANPNIDCVITVAATQESDQKAVYSNWGDLIDVSAPGGSDYPDFSILSLKGKTIDPVLGVVVVNQHYLRLSGTSMATPHVSAVASMILSKAPSMSNDEVRQKILDSVDDLGDPGKDIYFGYGRLNADKSLTNLCVPACSGKECGDDGCGGTCPPGCQNDHGSTSCKSGKCSPVCDANFGNCDSNTANGCETDLTTEQNCGKCGTVCTGEQECINGQCKVLECSGPSDCNDNNECTADTCDAGTCLYTNFPDGKTCTGCEALECVCKSGKCEQKTAAHPCAVADIFGSAGVPDGEINGFDLSFLLGNWKWKKGESASAKKADFWGPEGESDGEVNSYDLSKLLGCYKVNL
jgi:hypothetical protein